MITEKIEWIYKFEDKRIFNDRPDWTETFETSYNSQPVTVTVKTDSHPIKHQQFNELTLRIYDDSSKRNFVGLMTGVGRPEMTKFIEPWGEFGQIPVDSSLQPNLEHFISCYKPIFETHKDLFNTYKGLL